MSDVVTSMSDDASERVKRNEMKSFRLYVPSLPELSDGSETAYTPEEIRAAQEQFRPIAKACRRIERQQLMAGLLLAALLVCGAMYPQVVYPWLVIPSFAIFLWLFAFLFWTPALRCPGCQTELRDPIGAYSHPETKWGEYCPSCGRRGTLKTSWMFHTKCTSCGFTLGYAKGGRSFRIRACTYCGLPLDEEGV